MTFLSGPKNIFSRYREYKGVSVLQLAEIFKYCHGLMAGREIERYMIREEEDLFTILEKIKYCWTSTSTSSTSESTNKSVSTTSTYVLDSITAATTKLPSNRPPHDYR